MALIKCPDCATEVSDQAPTCPKCARPIKAEGGVAIAGKAVAGVGSFLAKAIFYTVAAVATFGLMFLLGPSIFRRLSSGH